MGMPIGEIVARPMIARAWSDIVVQPFWSMQCGLPCEVPTRSLRGPIGLGHQRDERPQQQQKLAPLEGGGPRARQHRDQLPERGQ